MNHAQAVSDRGPLVLAWTGADLVGPGSPGAALGVVLRVGAESCHRLAVDLERGIRAGLVGFPGDSRRCFVACEFRIYGLVGWSLSSGSASPGDRTAVSRGPRGVFARRWIESKQRIERILARDETDADALMQLGSLYVRTREPALARHAFHQCLESRGAKWRWEIQKGPGPARARSDELDSPLARDSADRRARQFSMMDASIGNENKTGA